MIEKVTRGIGPKIERFLYKQGFVQDSVRSMMRAHLILAGGSSLFFLVILGFSTWALAFTAGAALMTMSLWTIAKVVQQLVYRPKGAQTALMIIFYGKLVISGAALYLLLAVWRVPVWGLVSGLSTVAVSLTAWGLSYFGRKSA